jgi:hypothetical protein
MLQVDIRSYRPDPKYGGHGLHLYPVMHLHGQMLPIFYNSPSRKFIIKAGNRWGIKISGVMRWVMRIIISNSTSMSKCLQMGDNKVVVENEEKSAVFLTEVKSSVSVKSGSAGKQN